jgi:hypothetical protein
MVKIDEDHVFFYYISQLTQYWRQEIDNLMKTQLKFKNNLKYYKILIRKRNPKMTICELMYIFLKIYNLFIEN